MADFLSEMEWSRVQIMNLIELYREKQVLWDQAHPGFKNKNMKNYAWNDISNEMMVGKAEIQSKIKSLIAQFQRETKKEKSVSGNWQYKSKWYAFHSLEFLKDRTTPRNTREVAFVDIKIEENNVDDQPYPEEYQNDTQVSKNYTVQQPINPPRKLAKNKRYNSIAEELYEVMKKVSGNLKSTDDELDVFGRNVAFQIRNLKRKRDQAIAKHKINNILYEMEINQLTTESEYASTSGASSAFGTPSTSGAS